MRTIFFSITLLLLLGSCQSSPTADLSPKDLMPYGIPVTVLAPDSVAVKSSDLGGIIKDVTLKGEDGRYDLQVMASSATSNDLARVKAEQLASVKGSRYFSKLIKEEANGFLYEMALDSTTLNYGFRYIVLQGDQEIVFQSGMASTLALEEAERMYEAVKQQ